MSKIMEKFERKGDKKNSQFFEDYLPKIYDRREKAGLDDLIVGIRGLVVQVEHGEAIKYMMELYLMSPYRFEKAYITRSHRVYVLRVKPEFPAYIILEPNTEDYDDEFTGINKAFPRAKEKTNVRYLGEIFKTKDSKEVRKILSDQEFRFMHRGQTKNAFLDGDHIEFTQLSYFTNNIVGYTDTDLLDFGELRLGEEIELSDEDQEQLKKADEVHRMFGLHELVRGVDHLASRVFCGSREDALLEFLSLTNYYFWGAYNIHEMNSSTNVTRNPNIKDELHSPAKVFTANNTPYYVKSIDGLPSPTEDFVRNFGRRMHHIAYEVVDGEREDGIKNIDYVVGKLIDSDIPFLAKVIGECTDFPDLKQIFSKSSEHSFLITEYVQRCQGFGGFFTKTNVASLTAAAGEDEKLKESGVAD